MDRYTIENGVINIYRYKVIGINNGVSFEDMAIDLEYANFSKSKFEEIGAKNVEIIKLDYSDVEWLDGINAKSFPEAQTIYQMGEEAYINSNPVTQMQLALAELAELVVGGAE